MTKDQLKLFILNNTITKTGGLNNRACIQSWWTNNNTTHVYENILHQSSHLDIYEPTFAERMHTIVNYTADRPTCQVCNHNKCNFKSWKDVYYEYCSVQCATQSKERNKKISAKVKAAVPETMEKVKQNNLLKYGKENYYETDEFKQKSKETKLKRYGNEHYCNKEQSIKTCLEKYGVEYTCQTEAMITKSRSTRANTNPEIWNAEWLREQNSIKGVTQISEELDLTYRTVSLAMERLGVEQKFFHTAPRTMQNEIYEFVQSFGYETLMEDRTIIKPKEIDILVKSKNIGIELNGIYWHSVGYGHTQEEKMKHYNKTKLCNQSGIRLIQLWDLEWVNKKEICKDIIRRSLSKTENIHYAKQFTVKMVENKEYNTFLDDNHIQGYAKAKYKYGLYMDNVLYSVMSFGQSRFEADTQELIRFCTLINHNIIGGAEKLFKFHTKNNNDKIVSYCDNRLFIGNMYSKLGFTKISEGTVDYMWVDNRNKTLSRYKTQKHKLEKLLGDKFDNDKTEDQMMYENDYKKLYGCGHSKWKYKGQ